MKRKEKLILYLSVLFVSILMNIRTTYAQVPNGDLLLGDWTDSKKETIVHCYKQDGKYYAKTIWIQYLAHPDKPLPKHMQKWLNVMVMKDFKFEKNEWTNGVIFQPRTNKTYSAYIRLKDNNTMQVTGYVWLRFFSESETFSRVSDMQSVKLY